MENPEVAIAKMGERLASIETRLSDANKAAHTRIDKLEQVIDGDLKTIMADVKELMGWMNRGKGWSAAALLLAAIVGSLITKLIK